MSDAVTFSPREQRREEGNRYTEWIQVVLLVLMVGLIVYILITR